MQKRTKKILAPVVKENPPDRLRFGITTKKPTKEQVDRYLEKNLILLFLMQKVL